MDNRQWEQNLGTGRYRYEEPPKRNWGGVIRFVFMTLVFLGILLGAGWYFSLEEKTVDVKKLPVIEADPEPAKIMPENVGKVNVPHQDKLFYNQVTGKDKPTVEHLLPPPEEPMSIGEQPVATTAPAPTTPNEEVVEFKEVENFEEEPPEPAKPLVKEEVKLVKKEEPIKKQEPIVKEEPAAKPTTPQFGVQIAAALSLVNAKKEWSLITRQAPELLGSYEVQYPKAKSPKKGMIYRVQIGGFGDKVEASKLCQKLKEIGIKCRVVPYKK